MPRCSGSSARTQGNVIQPPPNLAALRFREEEGSFLAGPIAALAGGSDRVGFVGGKNIPLIHKFEAGYRAGVICTFVPDCEVVIPSHDYRTRS